MTRTALIALAGIVIGLAEPVAAQSANQSSAPAQPTPPAQAAPTPPAENAAPVADSANAAAQSADTKANPRAKAADNSTCTAITAGPNQGQFIGKCKHRR